MLSRFTKGLSLAGILLAGALGGAGVATAVEIGEKAPDFTLSSTTGKDISLSQFQGKQLVFIEFYGADFSPVCAANLSARKADYQKFEELNVQILGIANTLPFSQKAFADSLKLQYPLLSDTFMKVAKAYGVVYGSTSCVAATPGCDSQKIDFPGLEGRLAKRSFFLVDKDGIVRGKWIGEDLPVFSTEVFLKAAREISGKPTEGAGAKKPTAM